MLGVWGCNVRGLWKVTNMSWKLERRAAAKAGDIGFALNIKGFILFARCRPRPRPPAGVGVVLMQDKHHSDVVTQTTTDVMQHRRHTRKHALPYICVYIHTHVCTHTNTYTSPHLSCSTGQPPHPTHPLPAAAPAQRSSIQCSCKTCEACKRYLIQCSCKTRDAGDAGDV